MLSPGVWTDFLRAKWPDARELSVIVQLSAADEYEGVALRFRDIPDALPEEARAQGAMVAFPSVLYHPVEPATVGMHRSLVGWYSAPPWR